MAALGQFESNVLNPEAYLNHLLTVLPERLTNDPNAKVDDLLPWTVGMRAALGRLDAAYGSLMQKHPF